MADDPANGNGGSPMGILPDPSSAVDDTVDEAPGDTTSGKDAKGRFLPGHPWRWKPGQPGNPNNLNRSRSAKDLDAKGDMMVTTAEGRRVSLRELAFEAIWRTAARGGSAGVAATREILDRTEGKVPLPFRMADPTGGSEGLDLDVRVEVVQSANVEEFRVGGPGEAPPAAPASQAIIDMTPAPAEKKS